ncbi:MAG TPA: hypothetical protein VJ932_08230, partial [Alkalispirochaeta sp.]|nr:hypothetical protein [Alkalispirochaeta sp.]
MQLKCCLKRPDSVPVVFLLAILLMVGGAVSAQEVRVHVLPAVNRTGEAQFDAVASTVTGTVSLTLRLLDRYSITEGVPAGFGGRLPLPESGAGRSGLLVEMAESIPAENIVFGEVVSTASGSGETEGDVPELILYVYDRLQERVVLTERRQPDTLFDIFVATDELTAALLTSFSGRRVAFGSLRIVPTIAGADEASRAVAPDYTVTLDGQPLGQNLRSIDSILTGEHTLTVTVVIDGERRTLYNEEITVREGGGTRVALLLPNVAVLEAEAADEEAARQTAAEEAQRRLAAALEALAAERRNNQYALAEEYYLRADEFIDPLAIREAARENAAQAAAFEITRGQRLLSDRQWETGVASHRLVAELGRTFDSRELFGEVQEVTFVAEAWNEKRVRANRKPFPFLPLGILGWAGFWLADGSDGQRIGTADLQNQNVFALPMLFGAGFLGLWNATDWNLRRPNRVLQRYGETGGVPGGRFKRWNPKRWQVGIGATYSFGETGAFLELPESIGSLGARAFSYSTMIFPAPTIHGRYWFSPSHGFELRYRVTPVAELIGFGNEIVLVSHPEDPENNMPFDSDLSISTPIDLSLSWLYTRSGRSRIDLGFAYRTDILHANSLQIEEYEASEESFSERDIADAYEQLAGREEIIHVPGLRIGYAYRFGRPANLPWELRLGYQLDYV